MTLFKVTIKKTVEETYIIEKDEAGGTVNRDKALRMATVNAQMSEEGIRHHKSRWPTRVHGSQKVLGILDISAEEIKK